MGRHAAGRGRRPVALTAGLLVLAVLGWVGYRYAADRLGGGGCPAAAPLAVAAAPDIAPVVEAAARRIAGSDPCAQVRVASRASAAVAADLVTATELPDVWIPESTRWLQQAQAAGAWAVPVTGTSVASSPVVLAVAEDAARGLGWPGAELTWAAVLAGRGPVGLPDPAQDPVGVSTLLGVAAVGAAEPDPGAATTELMRALSPHTRPGPLDLADPDLAAVPTSEAALLRHGGTRVAAYADVPALDFPYAVLPRTDARDLAQRFLAALLADGAAVVEAGLRAPDGSAPGSLPRRAAAPMPDADTVDALLNRWAGVNRSARVQVLLDVSGSMAQPVPGAGTDRMGVTLRAAELGLGLFKPTTRYGMWTFSTRLDGDKDYRELIPMAPVATHLAGDALPTMRAVEAIPGGATGLYDTVLAAYRSARQNWEPGRINLVIVLTDGRNEDPDGITRPALLAELAALQDPRRPLPIISIGIGPDTDTEELSAITRATGGHSFTAPDPTEIGDIFYTALSQLAG
ncbi:substrate-binding domain-containing protein [Actinokineospora sp. NPDC004072]